MSYLSMFWTFVFGRLANEYGQMTVLPLVRFAHQLGIAEPITRVWECVDLLRSWQASPVVSIRKIGTTSKVTVDGALIERFTISKRKDGWALKSVDGMMSGFETRDDAIEYMLKALWV